MTDPRILLIDRHSERLEFAVEALRQAGYTTMTTADFSEAIKFGSLGFPVVFR